MISDKVVKSKIFDKMEIDADDDPLKELLLMDDVKKELDSWPSECNSPTSKKRRVDRDTEQNFIENLQIDFWLVKTTTANSSQVI